MYSSLLLTLHHINKQCRISRFHLWVLFPKNTFTYCALPLTICCCPKIFNNLMDVLRQSVLQKNATTLRLYIFGIVWKSSYWMQLLHYASWSHNCTKERYRLRNGFQSTRQSNDRQEEQLSHYFNTGVHSQVFNTTVKIYFRVDTPPLSVLLSKVPSRT